MSEDIDIEKKHNLKFFSPDNYKTARACNDAFMMSYEESALRLHSSNRIMLDEEDNEAKDSSDVTQKRQYDDFFSEYDSVKTRRILT